MRVVPNACCVGGPVQEMSPVSPGALLVIVAVYSLIGAIGFAAAAAFF